MIIPNGHLRFIHKQAGGIDAATGHTIKSVKTEGKPIACQHVPAKINLLAVADGEHYRQAQYVIYIDMLPKLRMTEQLSMYDSKGAKMGEFSIMSTEFLRAVNQIKITV